MNYLNDITNDKCSFSNNRNANKTPTCINTSLTDANSMTSYCYHFYFLEILRQNYVKISNGTTVQCFDSYESPRGLEHSVIIIIK